MLNSGKCSMNQTTLNIGYKKVLSGTQHPPPKQIGKYQKYIFNNNICFLKNGPIPASFSVYFRHFNMLHFKFKLKKA